MKNNMNILIATNSKYFMPTIVMLQSLFHNNKSNISIYLLYSELTNQQLFIIRDFVNRKVNGNLIFLEVDDTLFKNAPVFLHFTKEIYYRLLAQDILPKDLDRVLYLDVDIIINKSLDEFYNQSFDNKYFIVCEGIGMSQSDKQIYDSLGIPFDRKYFNSGVILYNLKLLREKVDTKIFFDFITKYSDVLKMPDQDTLNALFYDKVKYQDYRIYNCGVIHIKDKEEERYVWKNAVIIHYIGSLKPWHYKYISYLGDLFWNYAGKADFKNEYYSFRVKNILYKIFFKTKAKIYAYELKLNVSNFMKRDKCDEN